MASIFGAPSTADAVLQGVDLTGFRILVTGVSAGIGLESARVLAAHGAWVVGAARDLGKARAATAQVGADASSRGGLELVELDLASLSGCPSNEAEAQTVTRLWPCTYARRTVHDCAPLHVSTLRRSPLNPGSRQPRASRQQPLD